MRLWIHVNASKDQRPVCEGLPPEGAMLRLREFRVTDPAVPVRICDENGKVLVDEDREERL